MRILHLTLKKKWFDMIASGEKKEEYRELKPYFIRLLFDWKEVAGFPESFLDSLLEEKYPMFFFSKKYNRVKFRNGYISDSPTVILKYEGIRMGEGKPEWGAEPGKKYLIIELGDIIN